MEEKSNIEEAVIMLTMGLDRVVQQHRKQYYARVALQQGPCISV